MMEKNRSYCFYTTRLCLKMIVCPFMVPWEERGHKPLCVSLGNFFFISVAVPFTSACPACVHTGPHLRRTGKGDRKVHYNPKSWCSYQLQGFCPESRKHGERKHIPKPQGHNIYYRKLSPMDCIIWSSKQPIVNPAGYMTFSQGHSGNLEQFYPSFLKN